LSDHPHDTAPTRFLDADGIRFAYRRFGGGTTPDTIAAADAATFIEALGLGGVDVLAHSMGGLVAQQVASDRPYLVRRLVLVGTGPRGGEGIGDLPPATATLFTTAYDRQEEMWLPILFDPSTSSQAAGRAFLRRIMARPDRDSAVSGASVQAQAAAIAAYGARKDDTYAHLRDIKQPALVVNGTP
jgi:pimeloyl-ACP methyl ester carboxylesterase